MTWSSTREAQRHGLLRPLLRWKSFFIYLNLIRFVRR